MHAFRKQVFLPPINMLSISRAATLVGLSQYDLEHDLGLVLISGVQLEVKECSHTLWHMSILVECTKSPCLHTPQTREWDKLIHKGLFICNFKQDKKWQFIDSRKTPGNGFPTANLQSELPQAQSQQTYMTYLSVSIDSRWPSLPNRYVFFIYSRQLYVKILWLGKQKYCSRPAKPLMMSIHSASNHQFQYFT